MSQWCAAMLPLVAKYGEEIVSSIGLVALGYPALWSHTRDEAGRVEAAIRQHFREGE